jgi:hypothetical protein
MCRPFRLIGQTDPAYGRQAPSRNKSSLQTYLPGGTLLPQIWSQYSSWTWSHPLSMFCTSMDLQYVFPIYSSCSSYSLLHDPSQRSSHSLVLLRSQQQHSTADCVTDSLAPAAVPRHTTCPFSAAALDPDRGVVTDSDPLCLSDWVPRHTAWPSVAAAASRRRRFRVRRPRPRPPPRRPSRSLATPRPAGGPFSVLRSRAPAYHHDDDFQVPFPFHHPDLDFETGQ